MGEHLYTYADPPNVRHLDQIVDVLRKNGVIALPTGTNWAFCADPTSKKANQQIRIAIVVDITCTSHAGSGPIPGLVSVLEVAFV